jgi:hypothetical protein
MKTLKKIRIKYSRLPKKLYDYTEYECLLDEMIELEREQLKNIYCKFFCENLIVVYCG